MLLTSANWTGKLQYTCIWSSIMHSFYFPNYPVENKINNIWKFLKRRMHQFLPLPICRPPPSPQINPSFLFWKRTAHIRSCVKNLSVHFLPIRHASYYSPHLDIHQTSHVHLNNLSRSALVPSIGWKSFVPHIAQRCAFPLETRGHGPVYSKF